MIVSVWLVMQHAIVAESTRAALCWSQALATTARLGSSSAMVVRTHVNPAPRAGSKTTKVPFRAMCVPLARINLILQPTFVIHAAVWCAPRGSTTPLVVAVLLENAVSPHRARPASGNTLHRRQPQTVSASRTLSAKQVTGQ